MSTSIRLTPHSEELLQGSSRAVYIARLKKSSNWLSKPLRKKTPVAFRFRPSTKSPTEAVADILDIQKRNRLGGLKIKDLIHEGHKY